MVTERTNEWDAPISGGRFYSPSPFSDTAPAPTVPTPVAPGITTGALPNTNVGGIDYANIALQSQIAAAQQKYLMLRLQMLEIPQYLAQTDVDRHNLALQALNIYATQTGWIDTAALQQFNTWANSDLNYAAPPSLYSGGDTASGTGMYNTIHGQMSVDDMRNGLLSAGADPDVINSWSDQQIIDDYGNTTGQPVTPVSATAATATAAATTSSTTTNAPVQATATPAATTDYGYAANQTPTIAGAAQLTSPLGLAQNVSLLGLDSSSSLPAQTQQPTLQAQQIFANPSALPQSLVMSGLTTQAAADLIASSPMYQNMMQQSGVQPNVSSPLQPYNTGAAPSGFNFVQGNQLPGAQTLDWLATGDPRASVVTGLAAFSGQDPESFWKKFQSSVPTATASPLSKYL